MFKKCLPMFNYYSRRTFKKLTGFDWSEQEKILMEPFEYIKKLPCKHHKLIAPAFNHWLQAPEEIIDRVQKGMDTLCMWTILLDDMQDESSFRYGAPSAHKIYGTGLTLNTASNVLLIGQKEITDLDHPSVPEICRRRLEDFFHGQGCDIYWRNNLICPTEKAHIEMIMKKTGSWFEFPVHLLELYSTNTTDYKKLALNIGVYYEIQDGYYNLFHPKALQRLATLIQDNYVPCSDITECKITLAMIHAAQYPEVADEMTDILKQRTKDPKLQNHFISLLKKHGSDEYVRDKLRKLEADIRTEIDQFGGNPKLTAFMNDLSFQKYEDAREQDLYS